MAETSPELKVVSEMLGDRYAVIREIGSGGMATVYLADDVKHRRHVAVKVIRPDISASIGPQRFLREIDIAAQLSHPHILPLYDSGASHDMLYYVMPFIRGESLRQRLRRDKRLPIEEAIGITRQVAAALEHAHAHGVIHRDIKPENILLHEGEAMLADFGVAFANRSATQGHSRLTDAGVFVGTPDYMSPEQAEADPSLDARSDIYSLACVTFEMLTGTIPHEASSPFAVIAKRLATPAPTVTRLRVDVPRAVERALKRALSRDAMDRFESASAFAAALTARETADDDAQPCVAVLPFSSFSADPENEYFADGITEDVIAQLARIRALRVISRTSVMPFKNRTQSLREVGATLAATAILEGSVRRAGARVRIVAQLIDVASDQHLWAETFDRDLTDIFAIQSEVALRIAESLRAELTRAEHTRIEKKPTDDIEAYHSYLQGRYEFTQYTPASMRRSVDHYERAIARDPAYAMAYVGLAFAYTELAEIGDMESQAAHTKAREAARTAVALDDQLGEAHTALAYISQIADFDWTTAEREFKRAIELAPGFADTYDWYGRLCGALGRYDDSIELIKRAHELDPLLHRLDFATAYLRAGKFEESIRVARLAVDLDGKPRSFATLGWGLLLSGDVAGGIGYLETAVERSPDESIWLGQLGQAYGRIGETEKARAILRRLEERSMRQFVSPYHLAYVHVGLGEADKAMDYLDKAFEHRSGAIHGIKGSFLFAPLRGHPRFDALLDRLGVGR